MPVPPTSRSPQFYNLSKTHHPDHNRNDPSASQRFVKISEAYAILGSPQKREQYDRQTFRSSSSTISSDRGGSYRSSTGPVGGRPASGLSRRRTQFRGPPPSFYRSGGWGIHARKRQQAQANAAAAHNARTAQEEEEAERMRSDLNRNPTTSTHPNEKNFGTGNGKNEIYDDEDLPYFDRASHYRTQQQQQELLKRTRRRMILNQRGFSEDDRDAGVRGGGGRGSIPPHINTETPPSVLRSFLIVGGILTFSMALSSVFTGVFSDWPAKK
ncbi:MAG: hypothetical protein M1823_000557 [Watsoniomyces obsoletus]|nr:MAG: hypothetical protein M1823_000557 [Watsoniomyces obsoletus]